MYGSTDSWLFVFSAKAAARALSALLQRVLIVLPLARWSTRAPPAEFVSISLIYRRWSRGRYPSSFFERCRANWAASPRFTAEDASRVMCNESLLVRDHVLLLSPTTQSRFFIHLGFFFIITVIRMRKGPEFNCKRRNAKGLTFADKERCR